MAISGDVHLELGRLRIAPVCLSGPAQKRLMPANSRDLLLDEALWFARVSIDHDAFISAMLERDVEGLKLHDLLADSVADPTLGAWLLERMLGLDYVDPATAVLLGPWLKELWRAKLVERLVGGVARSELAWEAVGLLARRAGASDFPLPPLSAQMPPRHRLERAGKPSGRTRSRPARVAQDWLHRWRGGQASEGAFGSTRCDAAANAHRHRGLANRAHQQRVLDMLELDRLTCVLALLHWQERLARLARPEVALEFTPDGIQSQRLAHHLPLTKEPT